jgi:cytochrome c5
MAILASGALMTVDLVQAQERSGEAIVKAQCIKCHGTPSSGAPQIDDRAAWSKRMGQGLQATVASAIKGHGKMPVRGGMGDLTDTELRAAILYMFYPAGATAQAAPAAPAARADPHRRVVDGMEVFLGIAPAAKGSYHINISLRDAQSREPIKGAAVQVRVASTLGGSTKKLQPRTYNGAPSYMNDFRMTGNDTYTITAEVRRPGASQPSEAKFEFKP